MRRRTSRLDFTAAVDGGHFLLDFTLSGLDSSRSDWRPDGLGQREIGSKCLLCIVQRSLLLLLPLSDRIAYNGFAATLARRTSRPIKLLLAT